MQLHSLDLNKLHTFFVVAESEGVTRAAVRLGVTRSAVSQSVSGLEAALKLRLFHRVGRRLALTGEGRLLHARLREYQALLQRTLDEIVNEEREVRGLVRVGLFLGFSRLRLSRLVASFARRHPGAAVKVLYAPHAELAADLRGGRADVVFSLSPLADRGRAIRSARLFRQELVLAGAPRLVRTFSPLRDFRDVPLVDYYQSDPLILRWIRHHHGKRPPPLRIRAWAATTDAVLELLLNEVGLGVLPRDLAAPFVARRRLLVVESGHPPLTDFVWLNEVASTFTSPLLEAFRALIHEVLAP